MSTTDIQISNAREADILAVCERYIEAKKESQHRKEDTLYVTTYHGENVLASSVVFTRVNVRRRTLYFTLLLVEESFEHRGKIEFNDATAKAIANLTYENAVYRQLRESGHTLEVTAVRQEHPMAVLSVVGDLTTLIGSHLDNFIRSTE